MCDTFVALSSATADGSVIFGKNSDREPNEAQALEYHPAQQYSNGKKVRCTYIEIPQVKNTYGVLLSRPFWMWGAEIGANEKGVVIGETVLRFDDWSKMGQLNAKINAANAVFSEPVVPLLITHYAKPDLLKTATEQGVIVVQSFEWDEGYDRNCT